MSAYWVSHCSESTGQMVALNKVFKIRTFKQRKENATVFRIVFEMDHVTSNNHVTWEFVDRATAINAVKRIVKTIVVDATEVADNQLFIDLIKGFN